MSPLWNGHFLVITKMEMGVRRRCSSFKPLFRHGYACTCFGKMASPAAAASGIYSTAAAMSNPLGAGFG